MEKEKGRKEKEKVMEKPSRRRSILPVTATAAVAVGTQRRPSPWRLAKVTAEKDRSMAVTRGVRSACEM